MYGLPVSMAFKPSQWITWRGKQPTFSAWSCALDGGTITEPNWLRTML